MTDETLAAVASTSVRSGDPIFHPLVPLLSHRAAGPTMFVHGEGIYLDDRAGNRYIDGLSGLWNVNIGHGDPRVREAVFAQMEQLEYAPSFFGYTSEPAETLARELQAHAPGGPWMVFFTNGGSEAVETAIKLARVIQHVRGFPDRDKIISRLRGYHGSTIATTSATGIENYRRNIGPLAPGFSQVPPPYCYRCPWGKEPDSCGLECVQAVEQAILEEGPETVAAVIAEPVMATGGVIVPERDGYLQELRAVCDRHGVLFVDDEVVCGFGRTGRYFGVDHAGVVPDMMSLAKGISSAYLPMGALMLREELYLELEEHARAEGDFMLFHGFTTGGHPTACAAAVANLRVIADDGLVEKAARIGQRLQSGLRGLRRSPIVGDVRGQGLIAATELVADQETREPFDPALKVGQRVVREAFNRGLICRAVGGSDIVALAPPLIITEEQVDTVVDLLGQAIDRVATDLTDGESTR
jgi:putrescine---pyruvate transaminase